jgi:hypothetical protein
MHEVKSSIPHWTRDVRRIVLLKQYRDELRVPTIRSDLPASERAVRALLMKTTKSLFFELMSDSQSERWNEFELPKLSSRELLALAQLLGCHACGSKKRSLFASSHDVNCA